MKKLLLLLTVFAGLTTGASAQACVASDTTHLTGSTYVYPDSLPCITPGVSYSESLTFRTPSYSIYGYSVATDSVHIDTIENLPAGISYSILPATQTLYKGQYGCITLSGTTAVNTGSFRLYIRGKACFTIPAQVPIYGGTPECIDTNLALFYPITLTICDTTHTGIREVLNGVGVNIYPNPNQGSFSVAISASDRIVGDMEVIDQLGRAIYTQAIDVTGTKNVSLNLGSVAPGMYMLVIKTANGKSVKQFVVSK